MVEKPESRINHDLSEVDLALCRATLYSALALGFRPPTEETVDRLASDAGATALAEAAAVLDANGPQFYGPEALRGYSIVGCLISFVSPALRSYCTRGGGTV